MVRNDSWSSWNERTTGFWNSFSPRPIASLGGEWDGAVVTLNSQMIK